MGRRINALAAELTERGPGRFGHRETIRYLLDERAALLAALTARDDGQDAR